MAFNLSSKLSKLAFFKPKDSIAIDIGTSAIKILQLKESGNKFSLVKYGVISLLDNDAADLSPQDKKNQIVSKIAEFLAKEKILLKNIVTSISGHNVIVRYVKFPKLSRVELNKTILFEAEPYIPFDIKEVNLSYHIVGDVTEEGRKKMDAILVAAKKDFVQAKLDLFNELNLRLIIVDVDVFALQNAYEINSTPDDQQIVMLINIGSAVTNISIVENGVSKVVRDIFISGDTFTKVVQKNMGCDYKSAEAMKQKYSILVTAEEKEKTLSENQKEALQVSQALTTVSRDLLTEIHRSVDFFVSQNPEKTINKIMLCGGTANLKNLDKLMAVELKIPVEKFNPLKNITGAEIIPEETAYQFAIAIGLCTRKENDIK